MMKMEARGAMEFDRNPIWKSCIITWHHAVCCISSFEKSDKNQTEIKRITMKDGYEDEIIGKMIQMWGQEEVNKLKAGNQ